MTKIIDYVLDRITMYQLVLNLLIITLGYSIILAIFGIGTFSSLSIALSMAVILVISLATNTLFAYVYGTPVNQESAYITALILALIIPPCRGINDIGLIIWAPILAMASKYIFSINRKHIFNPAAIAVVLTSLGFNGSASWWVGSLEMAPVVIIAGLLIARKMRREELFISFILTALIATVLITVYRGGNLLAGLSQLSFHSSLFFLAGFMLTEPLTMPPTLNLQIIYGILTGVLFLPQFRINNLYTTPESALVFSNLFSYLVSPKEKFWLKLKEKVKISADSMDFVFEPVENFRYLPGQYMEWTLGYDNPDSRGNRRYFTLASSPTEKNIRIGVKFNNPGSSYKNFLMNLNNETPIIASQLAGNFTLPKDKNRKLVFIAGGIGVTPFRSMIKYLIDNREPRNIVLLYANKKASDIAYREIFDNAQELVGIRTEYVLTDRTSIPSGWPGEVGRIDEEMITRKIPDFKDRYFYLSGPNLMVTGFEELLKKMGVGENRIIKDYFPGLA